MRRPLSPCKACEDRNAECHGKCSKYNTYAIENEKYKELVHEERRKETSVVKYENERRIVMKKRYA